MKVERNSYALSLKKWKFDVKNCEVEVRILVKRNAAFHDFYSERHSNLCGKLVNFRTLCNCYIIPKNHRKITALFKQIATSVAIYHCFSCLSICIISLISVSFCFGSDSATNKVSAASPVSLITGCPL